MPTNHSCTDVTSLMSLYLDDELDEVGRGRMGRHLAACPACTSLLAEWRSLDALFRTAPTLQAPADFTSVVVDRAFAERFQKNLRLGLTILLIGTLVVGALALLGRIDLVLGIGTTALAPGFFTGGFALYLNQLGEALRLLAQGALFLSTILRDLALGPFIYLSLLSGLATIALLIILRQTREPLLRAI